MCRLYSQRISRRFIRRFCLLLFAAIGVGLSAPVWAITYPQADNFQGGTTQNWTNNQGDPMNPAVVDGGPGGAGDKFLEVTSTGIGLGGSRLSTFNQYVAGTENDPTPTPAQWLGNYIAAGVGAIGVDLKYIAVGDQMFDVRPIRVAFFNPNLSPKEGYASNDNVAGGAFSLPNDGAWHHWTFALTSDAMTLVGGTKTLAQTMSNPTQFRILSSAAPSGQGDQINVQLGIDNITAIPAVIAGDFNRDGHFNVADVQAMASAMADLSGYQAYWGLSNSQLVTLGNFNTTDMSVNNLDFQGLITALANGAGGGALSAVPEPGTLTEAAIGGLALVIYSAFRLALQAQSRPVSCLMRCS